MGPRTRSPYPRRGRATGFTLIEMIVVLVIVGVLAAILTPILAGMIDEARLTRASRETQTIAEAAQNFRRTTGRWPVFVSGVAITTSSAIYDVLLGAGNDPLPSSSDWLTGARGSMEDIFLRNSPAYTTMGRFGWRGPYLSDLGADPWGNAYLINSKSLRFGASEAAFALSAGPDGTIETAFQQTTGSGSPAVSVAGDDIAARIR